MRLLNQALSVLSQHYELHRPNIEWIQNEPDKTVWKVIDKYGTYILKSDLKTNPSLIPSIYLQYDLSLQGLNVPEIISTNRRKLCVKLNNRVYFLCRYIHGQTATVLERTKAIGDFHQQARPPHSWPAYRKNLTSPVARAKEWVADYEIKLNQLKQWEQDYALPQIRPCIQLAKKSLKVSTKRIGALEDHFRKVNEKKWLVHGDLTHRNAINTKSGDVWLIDLEHSKVDSPVKDIRSLLPKILLSSMYEIYFSRFSDGRSFEELYYMDAMFPHGLHSYIGGVIRQHRLPMKPSSIQEIVLDELHKDEIISKLWSGH
ncbi:phosphotransferase [Paenibacillus sp. DMB20]|uniref:phosphotransferase n=1 Tax=Paenibacillus sp. DMB20 TaxID=1642570 RepID=UPI00062787D0|nr:phosphotransferase [Paenibacillus sp. DMB20]KKO54271.1 hypothetical protein XI25_09540 [Paenibacillus sp. DMB20]